MNVACHRRHSSKLAHLGDLIEFRNDVVHPHDNPRGSAVFVGLEHIERNTGIRIGEIKVELSELTGRRARFKAGDIVYGYLRPYLNKVWIAEFDGVCSVDQYVFIPRRSIDRNYLAHFLRSDRFLQTAPVGSTPGQLPRIRSGEIAATPIDLPPLEEQRRIASILDKADALRRKRRRSLELLDTLTQSIFLDMFGDPITNPRGWPVKSLAEYETFLTSGSRGWARYYSESGRGFIRIQNLRGGELSTDDMIYVEAPNNAEALRTTVKEGDVLISITADLGRTAVVPKAMDGAAHINQHIALVRTAGINPAYLAMYLASPGGKSQFEALNRQGVKAGLNFDNIRELRILEPPVKLQKQFVARKRAAGSMSDRLSFQIENIDQLFTSLQHRAFSGQL